MDNGSKEALTLFRLPEGGFMVLEWHHPESGYLRQHLFAATTIDECLGFMRDKIKPIPAVTSAKSE